MKDVEVEEEEERMSRRVNSLTIQFFFSFLVSVYKPFPRTILGDLGCSTTALSSKERSPFIHTLHLYILSYIHSQASLLHVIARKNSCGAPRSYVYIYTYIHTYIFIFMYIVYVCIYVYILYLLRLAMTSANVNSYMYMYTCFRA